MAEEWGIVVLGVDRDLAASFAEADGSLEAPVSRLAALAGLDAEALQQSLSTADTVEVSGRFVALSYHCSERVDFSQRMMESSATTRYFARHSDEYGIVRLFSLDEEGNRIRVLVDQEDEIDEATRLDIGRWVASLPTELSEAFPDLNCFEPKQYTDPTTAPKTPPRPRPQTNLNCAVPGRVVPRQNPRSTRRRVP